MGLLPTLTQSLRQMSRRMSGEARAFSPAPASKSMRALARGVAAPSGSPTNQQSPPACTMTPGSRTLFEL